MNYYKGVGIGVSRDSCMSNARYNLMMKDYKVEWPPKQLKIVGGGNLDYMKVNGKWHFCNFYRFSTSNCMYMDLVEVISIPPALEKSQKELEDIITNEKPPSPIDEQQIPTLRKRTIRKT